MSIIKSEFCTYLDHLLKYSNWLLGRKNVGKNSSVYGISRTYGRKQCEEFRLFSVADNEKLKELFL